jgi:sigma-E factor negative regulatory protein RseC
MPVVVCASPQVAAHALLLGFGIPFLLLVGVVVLMTLLGVDEAWAALAGLTAMIPYYIILYFLRGRLREKLAFTLEDR